MFSTMELIDIEAMFEATVPCESSTVECNAEAEYKFQYLHCSCYVLLCGEHLTKLLERVKDWFANINNPSGTSRCSLCKKHFDLPPSLSELYRVTSI